MYQHLVNETECTIFRAEFKPSKINHSIASARRNEWLPSRPPGQEMILLSSMLGVSALVRSLNDPVDGGVTENSILGPFSTEGAEDGESL